MNLPKHINLTIEHNPHTVSYQSIEDWGAHIDADEWSDDEARTRCVATDEVWVIQWYPSTPVSFCQVVAPTLGEAIAAANQREADRDRRVSGDVLWTLKGDKWHHGTATLGFRSGWLAMLTYPVDGKFCVESFMNVPDDMDALAWASDRLRELGLVEQEGD